jgi:hypothetical protein
MGTKVVDWFATARRDDAEPRITTCFGKPPSACRTRTPYTSLITPTRTGCPLTVSVVVSDPTGGSSAVNTVANVSCRM